LQLPGAVASGVALVAFSATPLIPPPLRLAYAIGGSCLFRLAYTFYDLPQNSILALVRGTDAVRVRLAALRLIHSSIASVTVAVATALLVVDPRGQGKNAFLMLSVVLAFAGVASALALRLNVAKHPGSAPSAVLTSPDSGGPPFQGLRTLLVLLFVVSGSTAVFGRLEAYFAAAAFRAGIGRTLFMTSVALGGAAGQSAWAWLLRRRGAEETFRASAALLATACVMLFCAPQNSGVFALAGFIYGGSLGGLALVLWSSVAQRVASAPGGGHYSGTATCLWLADRLHPVGHCIVCAGGGAAVARHGLPQPSGGLFLVDPGADDRCAAGG
jgi:glycoside/pentoside/hexuronide:cation symporter, GPH family